MQLSAHDGLKRAIHLIYPFCCERPFICPECHLAEVQNGFLTTVARNKINIKIKKLFINESQMGLNYRLCISDFFPSAAKQGTWCWIFIKPSYCFTQQWRPCHAGWLREFITYMTASGTMIWGCNDADWKCWIQSGFIIAFLITFNVSVLCREFVN